MDVIYAAEKSSIARLLSDHVEREVGPEEIEVMENPDETGSFFIGLQFARYRMAPDGKIVCDSLR